MKRPRLPLAPLQPLTNFAGLSRWFAAEIQAAKEEARRRRYARGGDIKAPQALRAAQDCPLEVSVDVYVPVRRVPRVGKKFLRARIRIEHVDLSSTPRDMLDKYFSTEKFTSLVYKDRSSSPSCDRRISTFATWFELHSFYHIPLKVDMFKPSHTFVLFAH